MPWLRPNLRVLETGCLIQYHNGVPFLVVSPDGEGHDMHTDGGSAIREVYEIKCPMPNKEFTTDQHYALPKYYVPQILSEMAITKCSTLLYVCYTQESTTVLEITFDSQLWESIMNIAFDLYGECQPSLAKKKHLGIKDLEMAIKEYVQSDHVKFVAELPSTQAVVCSHPRDDDEHIIHGTHTRSIARKRLTVKDSRQAIHRSRTVLNEVYSILRLPAKEVLVVVMSDLDRQRSLDHDMPHAVPVAFGLSGYSLTGNNLRSLLIDILCHCKAKGIHVPVVSSDGQFHSIAVTAADGSPLTLLQVAKMVWKRTQKMDKNDQLRYITNRNCVGHVTHFHELGEIIQLNVTTNNQTQYVSPIMVGGMLDKSDEPLICPPNIGKYVSKRQTKSNAPDDACSDDLVNSEKVCALLPSDVIDKLDVETLALLEELNQKIDSVIAKENSNAVDDMADIAPDNATLVNMADVSSSTDDSNVDSSIILLALQSDPRSSTKWADKDINDLNDAMSTADSINSSFRINDLKIALGCMPPVLAANHFKIKSNSPKYQLVNMLAQLCGNSSLITPTVKKNPSALKTIAKQCIQAFSKIALNIIVATNTVQDDITQFYNDSPFSRSVFIENMQENYVFYSKPEYFPCLDEYIYMLLDCHHIFVNGRCTVCAKGIYGLGVKKEAWVDLAKDYKSGLNPAIVIDLIDRQANSFAKKTFSVEVELELKKRGWLAEAEFTCAFRNWYCAEDDPNISVIDRHRARMELRSLLLRMGNVVQFPPHGRHIMGMPIVMFDGILTNIDRRIQLYAHVKKGSYNVRSLGTLDSENFFGEFQDLDPKGQGVLTADDIPGALESASYIIKQRLDADKLVWSAQKSSITHSIIN